jgi:hypothetical protein
MWRLTTACPALAFRAASAYGGFCRRIDPVIARSLWNDRWEVADESVRSRRRHRSTASGDTKIREAEARRATCDLVLSSLSSAASWSDEQQRCDRRALASRPFDPSLQALPRASDNGLPF